MNTSFTAVLCRKQKEPPDGIFICTACIPVCGPPATSWKHPPIQNHPDAASGVMTDLVPLQL